MIATMTPSGPEVAEIPAIELVHAMPGFPGVTRFALVQVDQDGVLCQLRSLDDPSLRFLVMPPAPFFPDYAPVVSDDVVADLGIISADDVIVLLVLNAGTSLESTTANLLAPILINTATLRAAQIVLEDADLPIAAPLFA